MPALPDPPLLLITDRTQAGHALEQVACAALLGGGRWISLREKDVPAAEQIALLARLKEVAGPFGARVLIHGPAELAAAAGADGVHLAADGDARSARDRLGPQALIGQSIHDVAEAGRADPGTLDYVVAGPAFPTRSKPGYGPALEREGLRRLVGACRVPLLALGGIDAHTLPLCRAAGVAGVAVMGGVMRASDPCHEMRMLVAAWTRT